MRIQTIDPVPALKPRPDLAPDFLLLMLSQSIPPFVFKKQLACHIWQKSIMLLKSKC
jgi:hypothetical protein